MNGVSQIKIDRSWIVRGAAMVAAIVLVILFARWGEQLRRWTWETTSPIRFTPNVGRDFAWGKTAAAEGVVNQYEKMQSQPPTAGNWLDYAPLKLWVLQQWGKWAGQQYPKIQSWQEKPGDALYAPMIQINLAMECVGIVCAMALAWLWAQRGGRSEGRCWLAAALAGSLLWFNPSSIISAYGMPATDAWVVPFFLLAMLLASLNWWFTAGVVIAAGAMLKGQQLLVTPIFVIWAVTLKRPVFVLRWSAGFVLGIAVIVSPWLSSYMRAAGSTTTRSLDVQAIVWVLGLLLVSVVPVFVRHLQFQFAEGANRFERTRKALSKRWMPKAIIVLVTAGVVIWPWMISRNRSHGWVGLLLAAIISAAGIALRRREVRFAAAGFVGMGLLLCMSIFHGSSSWWDCGFVFPMKHWATMTVGVPSNLPAMLPHFGWRLDDPNAIAAVIPIRNTPVTIQNFLRGLFGITVLLSGAALGMHARRKDTRVLLAMVTPWIMLFVLLPQLDERYLVYAAAISCIAAGDSIGMMLLGVFLSGVSCLMMLHRMLSTSPGGIHEFGVNLAKTFPSLLDPSTAGLKTLRFVQGTNPDIGWAVLLSGMIYLYYSLALRRRVKRISLPGADLQKTLGRGDANVLVAVGQ